MPEQSSLPDLPLDEINRLRTMVGEVKNALKNQAELLQMRGISLAPGALTNLDSMEGDLSTLQKNLGSESTELLQLRTLAATSALINSSRDLDTVFARAMEEVIRLTGAERGYIVLIDPQTNERVLRMARDLDSTSSTFQGSNTILNEVLETGVPLLADNAYKDPRFENRGTVTQNTLRSVLCVPLKNKAGRVVGAVYVDNRLLAGIFDQRILTILSGFANQMAVAVENADLFMLGQANLNNITELNEVRENVFGSIESGVITTDSVDAIRTINSAAAQILNCPRDTSLNKSITDVLPAITSDHLNRVRQGDARQSFEETLQTPDGEKIVSIKLGPLKDADGNTQGVAVVLDDVTEQRERDAQLNVIRRYLPPAMVDNIEVISGLALGGERRELTCMYVDVRPLSTFPPDLRPREVMALLNEYHDVATACINNSSGVIDKYMGTEIMALYNTQLNPMDDHAHQALEAALLMREAFIKLYEWQGIDPQPHFFRIGIHSGVATIGNVGSISRRDFTALGDTINLAHRLLENAKPGQILVSEACCGYIYQALGKYPDHVLFGGQEPIRAKGRQQTTTVYEVLSK
ncbi:MAG: GAF domain-containing protein [Chloroflexi bacterium]|nr:GAF domain-containing protein [Chloroflexota bacterium]MCC6896243.1 GAF domain-containing protein [Anaerolineae bacterium]